MLQLAKTRDDLRIELSDQQDALRGEQEAREAATEELNARLAAKEHAEEVAEEWRAKYLDIEKRYLAKVAELAKARDAANAEVCAQCIPQGVIAHVVRAHSMHAREAAAVMAVLLSHGISANSAMLTVCALTRCCSAVPKVPADAVGGGC